MIVHDTRIEGFDARSWHRLLTLLVPGAASHPPQAWSADGRARGRGGVVLVQLAASGDVATGAVHSARGALPLDAWSSPRELETFAQRHDARFAVALRPGALASLYERLGGRLTLDDDTWTTLWVLAGAARELLDERAMYLAPGLPPSVPLPPANALRAAWDRALPSGHGVLIALFDEGRLDTGLVAHREGAGLTFVHGPEVISRLCGPLRGDLEADHRTLRAACDAWAGPLSLGLYARTEVLRALLRNATPGAWTQAVARREVIFDPLPTWAGVAVGADAVRLFARNVREVATLMEAVAPVAVAARAFASWMAVTDLRSVMGFDPLDALSAVLRRSASNPDDDEALDREL